MTASSSIDPADFQHKHLAQSFADLMPQILNHVHRRRDPDSQATPSDNTRSVT